MTAERAAPVQGDQPPVTPGPPELPTMPLTLPFVGAMEPRPDARLPADVAELLGIGSDETLRRSPET